MREGAGEDATCEGISVPGLLVSGPRYADSRKIAIGAEYVYAIANLVKV